MSRESIEQVKLPGKWSDAVFWGCVWAPVTVLLITLFDWYRTRRLDSFRHIVLTLVIFVTAGVLYRLVLRRYQESRVGKEPTRAGHIKRTVPFVVLMAGLMYVLWIMVSAR